MKNIEFLQVDARIEPPEPAAGTDGEQPIREPTPWCRKVQGVWFSQCVFIKPEEGDTEGKARCTRILNSWLQKCVQNSDAARRHSDEVDKENAPNPA